jgi:hypothetical protein
MSTILLLTSDSFRLSEVRIVPKAGGKRELSRNPIFFIEICV